MKVGKHNSYKISISGGKYQCIEVNGERGNGFIPTDVADNMPKLYVVKHNGEAYYVRITRQDIRKRLRYGFSAKGTHGYYGYKWKELDEAELMIWSFPNNPIEDVEAIEAELVYFIREKTGRWPKYQMEIHFHGASELQMKAAKLILRETMIY